MSFFDSAIRTIGEDLATTAATELKDQTGVDVGGALGKLFGNGQAKGGADLDNVKNAVDKAFGSDPGTLDSLKATLDRQSLELDALGEQLTGIANAISALTGQIDHIEAMLEQIGQEQRFQEWQAVDNQMISYISAIDVAYRKYGNYVSAYKTTPPKLVETLAIDILNPSVGPSVGISSIHEFMLGSGSQSRGALQLWSQMVTPLVQNGKLDYRRAVQQYFQYFQRLTYAQLRGVNLVMEAYNYYVDSSNAKGVGQLPIPVTGPGRYVHHLACSPGSCRLRSGGFHRP